MEKFAGTWKIESSENFDEYMEAVGVSFALRKIGKLAKPELTITVNGNNIKMKSVSTFRTFEAEANVGEEFDETTPDGRKVKALYKMEGDKLVQTQKWDGKETTVVRYVDSNGSLIMELSMGSVKAKRVYKK